VPPFLHAAGYIATDRGIVDLNNYEGTEIYFPTLFRPSVNPFSSIGEIGTMECTATGKAPAVDFLTYQQQTGARVDYVLLWAVRPDQSNDPNAESIFRQLRQAYDLIWISPESGSLQLYRLKTDRSISG
jgi:hypothetical protein